VNVISGPEFRGFRAVSRCGRWPTAETIETFQKYSEKRMKQTGDTLPPGAWKFRRKNKNEQV